MLATESIREKQSNEKWQELIQVFYKRTKEIQQKGNLNFLNILYKNIILDIKKIEKIEEILLSNSINYFPDRKKHIILERDELRIETSLKFLIYLVKQKAITLEKIVNNFLMGIECINLNLLHSGDSLYSLGKQKILFFIQNLYNILEIWKNINQSIEDESIWLVHENSLNLIYASLFMLEDTYRHLVNEQRKETISKRDTKWGQEDKRYENLLEDMEQWSNEEWTEEEQKTFKKAMSNLSKLSYQNSWATLFDSLEKFSDDFMEDDRQQPEVQERESAFE